jgi:predicted TIM-barrel fold metal-dependent hydrolase
VPLYLHPMPPPKAVYDAYYSGFGDEVGFMLAAGAWGWHIETGLHALRLMLAGVFDRFPALQVIIGHMGEVVPFMIERATGALGRASALGPVQTRMQLSPREYLTRNF